MIVGVPKEIETRAPRCGLARRRSEASRDEFAAEAAARRVPLKRQRGVSSLTRAEPRVHSRIWGTATFG